MRIRVSNEKIKKCFFYTCLIDILLLPYIRIFHGLLTMFILPFWYIKHIKSLIKRKDFMCFIAILILSLISVITSIFDNRGLFISEFIGTNIQYLIVFLYSIAYFIFFKKNEEENNYPIKKILIAYIMISTLFALLFWMNPKFYFQLRSFWTLSATTVSEIDLSINRFTFLLSDPNSIGCVLCTIFLYLVIFEKTKLSTNIFLVIIILVNILASMSTTGIIVYLLTLVYYLYISLKKRATIKLNLKAILAIVFIALSSVILIKNISMNGENIVEVAIDRYINNFKIGGLGGRTNIWVDILTKMNFVSYLLFGRGSLIADNYGNIIKPHNGHFYIILAYGFIVYGIFIYLFFRKKKSIKWNQYSILMPLLVLFTVNVLIIDFRASLFLAFIAALMQKNRRYS